MAPVYYLPLTKCLFACFSTARSLPPDPILRCQDELTEVILTYYALDQVKRTLGSQDMGVWRGQSRSLFYATDLFQPVPTMERVRSNVESYQLTQVRLMGRQGFFERRYSSTKPPYRSISTQNASVPEYVHIGQEYESSCRN